jgi:fatty acid desaturase
VIIVIIIVITIVNNFMLKKRMDWVSAIFALVIAILGFAFLAVVFSPRNIMSSVNTRKVPKAAIILFVLIIVVGIAWGIWHHHLRKEGYCYDV